MYTAACIKLFDWRILDKECKKIYLFYWNDNQKIQVSFVFLFLFLVIKFALLILILKSALSFLDRNGPKRKNIRIIKEMIKYYPLLVSLII